MTNTTITSSEYWKHVFKFGILGAGTYILLTVLLFSMGTSAISENYTFIDFILMNISIFLGVHAYRTNISDGTISFKKAFKIGISIILVYALVHAIWMAIFSQIIYPEYYTEVGEKMIRTYEKEGVDKEVLVLLKGAMENFYNNPIFTFVSDMFSILFIGSFFSILGALILKKK